MLAGRGGARTEPSKALDPARLWGQLDLAGELWEWNPDSWFDVAVEGGYVEPCVDVPLRQTSAPPR